MGEGGCYAEGGPLRIHWDKISRGEKGTDLNDLCHRIAKLPRNQLWRYGQAGDLPGVGDQIDHKGLLALAKANNNRPVIAFTHKPATEDNLSALKDANDLGFPVNLSADNLVEADELSDTGLNTVVVLDEAYGRRTSRGEWSETLGEYRQRIADLPRHTPAGRKVAICPATYMDTRCIDCRACSTKGKRASVIGFPAHGVRKKSIGVGLKN